MRCSAAACSECRCEKRALCALHNPGSLQFDRCLRFAGNAATADRGIPVCIGEHGAYPAFQLRIDRRIEENAFGFTVVADGHQQRYVSAECAELLEDAWIEHRRRLLGAEG